MVTAPRIPCWVQVSPLLCTKRQIRIDTVQLHSAVEVEQNFCRCTWTALVQLHLACRLTAAELLHERWNQPQRLSRWQTRHSHNRKCSLCCREASNASNGRTWCNLLLMPHPRDPELTKFNMCSRAQRTICGHHFDLHERHFCFFFLASCKDPFAEFLSVTPPCSLSRCAASRFVNELHWSISKKSCFICTY